MEQAADHNFSNGKLIDNPALDSHLSVAGLLPAFEVPGRKYITSFDPTSGLHLGTFVADSGVEIEGKIERAAIAQRKWRHTSFAERRRVIRSLKKWLVENQEACARVACRDTGKTSGFILGLI